MKVTILIFYSIILSLSFSCNNSCERFFTYSSKTIDIKGINTKLKNAGVEILDLGVAEISIKPEFVLASEKLQNLDLLQFKMCQDLSKLNDDNPKKEELIVENMSTYREMLKIAQGVKFDDQRLNEIMTGINKEMKLNSLTKNDCIDVVVPSGSTNPDALTLANEIEKYLRKNGYNLQNTVSSYSDDNYKQGVSYKYESNIRCLWIIVWLGN